MRQSTKKFKPNPSITSRRSIRSSSIRDIIGDRRFNHQFSHINTHGAEGIKKVKRMKVGDGETDDLPNMGRKASSSQCEAAEDPRKIPNVQKESFKHATSSLPVEKEQDHARYAFLTPVIGSKNSDAYNVLGSVEKVTPGEYNWLSPSMGSKTKTSGNKEVFSMKREKLRQLVADKSLYDVNEVSSKGFDLVSVLMSRILPKDHKNNCTDETNSKYKLTIKNHEANKRKFIEYLDDDIPNLEWNPKDHSEAYKRNLISYMDDDIPKSSEYDYKRKWSESQDISYLDDGFPRSLEWDPTCHNTEDGFKFSKIVLSLKDHQGLYFDNEPKLLGYPQPLLLGWEDKSEKDEFQTTFSTSLTSQDDDDDDDDCQLFMPIERHLKEDLSIIPYTPKHAVTWLNEKQECGSESFMFLFRSPVQDFFHLSDENGNNFLCGSDDFLEGKVKSYMERFLDDKDFDHPLLLRDSRENEF
ncbi:hypothetical protein L2E82_12982 [Cichorium intybus]|uniref:Uncharacterized protein n=1 Tax=Cichorium intybus TaxID=13427 RepID=A0ACB9GIC3_CICIN|nr:hypothetical protein L2E82_12982 [Cichorium intybus]